MVGGDISRLDLSLNSGNNFSFILDPKAAWFIQDNIAIGAYVNFELYTAKGAGSNINGQIFEIALQRELPDLRVAHPEVRIDGKAVRGARWACSECIRQRQRAAAVIQIQAG